MGNSATGPNLLMSLGLDLSPVKSAADTIKATLNNLNELADQVASAATSAAKGQSAEMAQLKAHADAAVIAAKEAIAQENLKVAALKTQTAELGRQQAEQRAVASASAAGTQLAKEKQAAAVAETAELKRQTAELQKQAAEMRMQAIQQRQTTTEKKEGGGAFGGATGLFQKISQGVLGGGLAGSVAGGLIAGEGVIAIIEGLGEAIERFIDKLKDLSVESGSLVMLENVFDRLASAKGVNAVQFMNQLGDASEGLVSKMSLLKEGTMALRSPFKLTTQDVTQLTHDVTVLAEASGHSAQQGIDTLTQAFARGRPMTLGMITGVAGLRDAMRDLPSSMGPAQRSMEEWRRVMKMLHEQAVAMGDLPDTFEKMSTRMKVASENMMLAFGMSFNKAFSGNTMAEGVARTTKLFNDLESAAARVGTAVGNAFRTIGDIIITVDEHATALKNVLEVAFGAGIVYLIGSGAAMLLRWGGAAALAAVQTEGLTGAIKGLEVALGGGLLKALAALLAYFSYRFTNDWRQDLSAASGATVTWGDVTIGVFEKVKTSLRDSAQFWHDVFTGDFPAALADFNQSMQDWSTTTSQYVLRRQQERLAQERQRESVLSVTQRPARTYGSQAEAAAAQFGIAPDPQMALLEKQLQDEANKSSLSEERKQAQELMQEKVKEAQALLQTKKDQIAQERELDTENYEFQNESLQQHYANLRDIAQKSHDVAITEAKQARDAAIVDAETNYKLGEDSQQTHLEKLKLANIAYMQAVEKAGNQLQLDLLKVNDQSSKDQQEAMLKRIEGVAQLREEALKRDALTMRDVQMQGATPDEYFQSQIDLIRGTAEAEIDKANQVYQVNKKSQDALQVQANAVDKAISDAQSKLQDLQDSEAKIRLQAIQWQFQPQQQAIEEQIGGLRPEESPAGLQQDMLDNLAKQRLALEDIINTAPQYSDEWYQIYSQIEKTYEMQQKYNDELRKSQDLLQPIADSLSSITKLIGTVWTSHFVRGLTAGLQGGIAALKGSTQAGTTIRNAFTGGSLEVQKDPQMQALEAAAISGAASLNKLETGTGGAAVAVNIFQQSLQTFIAWLRDQMTAPPSSASSSGPPLTTTSVQPSDAQQMSGGASDASVTVTGEAPGQGIQTTSVQPADAQQLPGGGPQMSLQSFSTGLIAAIGELTNFADALSKSTSAVGGALSGAVGGAGVGQTISTALNIGGPWGMIAGAVGGAIAGAITGAKNVEMSSELSQLNQQYTSLMDSFHSNTDNLQEAILQMQELISEAQVDEANSKKGGSQFASLISQYSQQLIQLQDQQSSIISDMETQLAIFSTPTGMQQFLTNLQQIIEQYDKFAGAAENASQLAQANSWLTDSLSSYTTQMENTFVQDEENGINDALNLNSLLSERSTLISNLNNSIMNVLEQGVLTRQQTEAQKKGQQIELLESQASSQLQSINQEISLEQYKVSIETSLFNLAMTSMGLEAQLLSLQEGQASQSLAAISALQELINALQSGSYNFGSISAILTALGYGNAASNIPPSGLEPGGQPAAAVASTGAMDALIAAAYQSRATLGYASFRGQGL